MPFTNVYKNSHGEVYFAGQCASLKEAQSYQNVLYTLEYNEHGYVATHYPPMKEGYYEVINKNNGQKAILYYEDELFRLHKDKCTLDGAWHKRTYTVLRKLEI